MLSASLNRWASGVVLACALACGWAGQAHAHFQMVYTPDLLLERGGRLTVKMPFTHPAISGYVMEMGQPLDFFMVRRGRRTDLTGSLRASNWTSAENTNVAYEAEVRLRGLGDYVFVLVPAPYYEATEEAYIQQITKTIVNVGSLPTDWSEPQGLPAEIRPLHKPYALYAGGVFQAEILSAGKPVPYAEVEIEYLNFIPDMANNRFADKAITTPPAEAYETISILADASGTVTFGLPRAGMWGFAALGVGPQTEYLGKPLSQDAVLWVQARPMQ